MKARVRQHEHRATLLVTSVGEEDVAGGRRHNESSQR
jgi:hypothetical protein